MNYQASDFPFTILDVADLLRLTIRRRSPGYLYADCPLCSDRRGKLCINLTKNVWCSNCCGEHGGMLALYAKVYRIGNSTACREICDALLTGGFSPEYKSEQWNRGKVATPQSELAPVPVIHQTFSALLSILTLTPGHRRHLQVKRGLTDEQIDSFGFKSTPPPYLCRSLTARLIKQGCTVQGVPGFYLDDSGVWTVKFYQRTAGILIPYRGVDGMIRGLQIRLDRPIRHDDDPPDKKGAKYLWLASTNKPQGVSSGSPIHFVGDPCSRVVYVTEGALKADVAHALMGRTFAATGGAGCISQLDDLFRFLSNNGTEEIIEAEDMDKYSNQGVQKGASALYQLAKSHGMKCRRLTWNPNYKGIDDWQLALRRDNAAKEKDAMNFKELYQNGLCGLDYIETCTEQWHQSTDKSQTLQAYLGLSEEEYALFVRTGLQGDFAHAMGQSRLLQRFRIYQLDLRDGRAVPFAFSGIAALQKAGYQQPPASEYRLVYEGELVRPVDQEDIETLERIFGKYSGTLPDDYHGRSISPSDVVELCSSENRAYFYRDMDRFVPVRFSPLLARKPAPSDGRGQCTDERE